eukprot:scaffold63184_cov66-Phaeocystis_antarctica.AAC.2
MAPSYARISALSSQASSSCRLPIGTHCFSGLMVGLRVRGGLYTAPYAEKRRGAGAEVHGRRTRASNRAKDRRRIRV